MGFWLNFNTEAIPLDKFSAAESLKCEGTQWGSKPMRHKDQQEQSPMYLLYLICRVSREVRTRYSSHSNWHANLRSIVRQLLFDFSANRLFLVLVFISAFLFFFYSCDFSMCQYISRWISKYYTGDAHAYVWLNVSVNDYADKSISLICKNKQRRQVRSKHKDP